MCCSCLSVCLSGLQTTEEYLSEVVSTKQLFAKIDRPAQVVVFKQPAVTAVVLNDWAADVSKLLGLVDECCHLINKEQMLHGVAVE